jgi:hypothetical protein
VNRPEHLTVDRQAALLIVPSLVLAAGLVLLVAALVTDRPVWLPLAALVLGAVQYVATINLLVDLKAAADGDSPA